jgi:hypothetical protein
MNAFARPKSIRRATTRRLVTAVVAGTALLIAHAPHAAGHGPDPVLGGPLFAQDQRLEFDWRSGSAPPTAIRTAIKAAADDANDTRASRAATFVQTGDGPNPIGYGAGNTCGPNGIACFTRDAPDGFTMWFREQGHKFDWGTLKWCQAYDSPPNGCFDVETIALDEFGHIEILAHHANYDDDRDYRDAVVQTVSRAKPQDGWNMHVFGRCDVATLQREYDVPNASSLYSTCLNLATVLSLSASPTSIPGGSTTTLTATLRVGSAAAYDRLRNNLVNSRTVSLQRRTPGASAWTTHGTMSPLSSGRYSLAVRLNGSAEFRAVFKTPTNEGLNGDTSPTVFVSVGACSVPPCPLRPDPAS